MEELKKFLQNEIERYFSEKQEEIEELLENVQKGISKPKRVTEYLLETFKKELEAEILKRIEEKFKEEVKKEVEKAKKIEERILKYLFQGWFDLAIDTSEWGIWGTFYIKNQDVAFSVSHFVYENNLKVNLKPFREFIKALEEAYENYKNWAEAVGCDKSLMTFICLLRIARAMGKIDISDEQLEILDRIIYEEDIDKFELFFRKLFQLPDLQNR